jgi:hypothetical protein
MRSLIVGLALLASTPTVTLAATLPLKEGVYSSAECSGARPPIEQTIFVAPSYDPQYKSEAHVGPSSEGKVGSCMLKSVRVDGDHYSGSAPCTLGMKANLADGTYKFDWQVIDQQTFVSRGATYRWCAPHR